jgi:DNA-binding transcriptional LysR family regulator
MRAMTTHHLAGLDWEDIRYFAALARHRTLAATARALDATPARVERRLRSLEATLGQTLFTRRSTGFRLNAAGAAALAEAAQMEMAACSLLHRSAAAVR